MAGDRDAEPREGPWDLSLGTVRTEGWKVSAE